MSERRASQERNTAETKIKLSLNLDGEGNSRINTGIPFFDHMLTLFSRHSLIDLEVEVNGDVDVDFHHTVEDTGIVIGRNWNSTLRLLRPTPRTSPSLSSKNSAGLSPRTCAAISTSNSFMEETVTTSPSPSSNRWPAPCAPPPRMIHA